MFSVCFPITPKTDYAFYEGNHLFVQKIDYAKANMEAMPVEYMFVQNNAVSLFFKTFSIFTKQKTFVYFVIRHAQITYMLQKGSPISCSHGVYISKDFGLASIKRTMPID